MELLGGGRPINLARPDAVGLPWPSQYKILRPQLRGFRRHSRIADSSSAKTRRLFIGALIMTSSQRVQEVRYAGRCGKPNWMTLLAMRSFSRSDDPVIRVYDDAGNLIETREHAGDFKSAHRHLRARRPLDH